VAWRCSQGVAAHPLRHRPINRILARPELRRARAGQVGEICAPPRATIVRISASASDADGVIEAARNLADLPAAGSTEFGRARIR